jgi:ketosteroid isomerase-like protein
MIRGCLKWACLGVLLMTPLPVVILPGILHAAMQLMPGSVTEPDVDTVRALTTAFEEADAAMRRRDIEKVMAFYSDMYNYHGLTKADIRKIWQDLFEHYRDIGSTHVFTLIRKTGSPTAPLVEITCSGSLRATSELTNLQVPIDSWYQEVHILGKENGAWRIRGNVGETPKVLPFGTAPHPLF